MQRFLYALAMALVLIIPTVQTPAIAQSEGVRVSAEAVSGQLGPGYGMGLRFTVINETSAPVIVTDFTFADVVDSTGDGLELCPRVWFGDAGYSDRPRGEDEQNPPAPPYPLQQPAFEGPVRLEPREQLVLPDVELYMIQAAPNQCQNRSLRMVTPVDWHFAPTYHAVSGTISDSATNQPISSATVTITGTTESGVTSEEVTADADGFYTSQGQYLAGTDLTVSAVAPSYTSNSVSGTVVQEGENTFNVALDPIPVTGTISGTITDSDTNEPIANAMVTITGTGVDGSEVSETTTSDSNGQYVGEIEFLAGTAVTVSATAEDYTGDAATIEAIEEGVNTANVALSPITLDESPTPDPEGTVTPTPSPEETVTPGPDPEGTVTPTPRPEGTETPTPVPTEDVPPAEEPTAPVTEPVTPTAPANEAESTPTAEATTPTEDPKNDSTPKAVTGLPSTGVGGAAPANLLLIGTIASAGIIGVAIRRTKD